MTEHRTEHGTGDGAEIGAGHGAEIGAGHGTGRGHDSGKVPGHEDRAPADPRGSDTPDDPQPAADGRGSTPPAGAVIGDPGGWTPPTARERLAILRRTRTVAMVGASSNPARPSYFVATYLLASTEFDVYFVNPRGGEVLGHPMYPSLADLPVTPDLVDVFRRPSQLDGVLDEAIAAGASTFWVQLGLWNDDVARRGHEAGMDVVMDRCLKIEHARFAGGLHLAGFDTGVITSRRTMR